MTNREWLESLSDRELAQFMDETFDNRCSVCTKNEDMDGGCRGIVDCVVGIKKWLQAEHLKEEEHI